MNRAFLISLTAIMGVAILVTDRSTATGKPIAETTDSNRQIETGQVNWLRNLDEAKKLSASADKPILLLFQEIPG